MDLNELFFRHQIVLMRADRSDDRDKRLRMYLRADDLALQIGVAQRRLGGCAAPMARAAFA